MTIPLFHVDAFTDRPFGGNPAAVCILPAWKEDSWLQAVAGEMNVSETAFLVKNADGFDLRWCTPKVEVDLCGHATLAAAHILWQQAMTTGTEIRFSTRSGILRADRLERLSALVHPDLGERSGPDRAGLFHPSGRHAMSGRARRNPDTIVTTIAVLGTLGGLGLIAVHVWKQNVLSGLSNLPPAGTV